MRYQSLSTAYGLAHDYMVEHALCRRAHAEQVQVVDGKAGPTDIGTLASMHAAISPEQPFPSTMHVCVPNFSQRISPALRMAPLRFATAPHTIKIACMRPHSSVACG